MTKKSEVPYKRRFFYCFRRPRGSGTYQITQLVSISLAVRKASCNQYTVFLFRLFLQPRLQALLGYKNVRWFLALHKYNCSGQNTEKGWREAVRLVYFEFLLKDCCHINILKNS